MKLQCVVKCDQKGLQVLGMIVQESGAQVMFFSIFQLQIVTLEGTDLWIQPINVWPCGWWYHHNF